MARRIGTMWPRPGCWRLAGAAVAAIGLLASGAPEPVAARPWHFQSQVEEHLVDIVVRLRRDVTAAFAGAGQPAGAAPVLSILRSFQVELTPMHPGIADPELGSWFVISRVAPARAEAIAAALRGLDAIEAAYVQPAASPA